MGFFENARNRLSVLFNGAPASEVAAVNNALRDVAAQSITVDDVEPAYRPNRKARREYAHSLRYRDRNTEFSKRSSRMTAKQLHKSANDKMYQFSLHPVLWALLNRGGYNRAVEGEVAA